MKEKLLEQSGLHVWNEKRDWVSLNRGWALVLQWGSEGRLT